MAGARSRLGNGSRPGAGPTLDAALDALAEAVDRGEPRLPAADLRPARDVLERAAQRRRIGGQLTVAALAGPTGAGKSSLLNRLAGHEVAEVSLHRPTTEVPLAVAWSEPGEAAAVLDWLGVPQRVEISDDPGRHGLVLLDLPDIDSTVTAHREQADRVLARADLLLWVLDPVKYADAVVHEQYLRRHADHGGVSVVVLNQVDRLDPGDAEAVTAHLRQLLDAAGLQQTAVVATSALRGQGIADLAGSLDAMLRRGRAAEHRIASDVRTVAGELARATGVEVAGVAGVRGIGVRAATSRPVELDVSSLVAAARRAAGAGAVSTAVRDAYLRAGRANLAWPPVRWLWKLRRDPLAVLRRSPAQVSSLPAPQPVDADALAAAAGEVAWRSGASRGSGVGLGGGVGLPPTWRARVVDQVEAEVPRLADALDEAMTTAWPRHAGTPRWWTPLRVLGWLLLGTAVVAGLWLAAYPVARYLHLELPEPPMLGPVAVPTLALIGGLVAGVLLAAMGGLFLRWSADRRARRLSADLDRAVAGAVDSVVTRPVQTELEAYRAFADALRRAHQGRARPQRMAPQVRTTTGR